MRLWFPDAINSDRTTHHLSSDSNSNVAQLRLVHRKTWHHLFFFNLHLPRKHKIQKSFKIKTEHFALMYNSIAQSKKLIEAPAVHGGKGWRAAEENEHTVEVKVWPLRSQLPVCEGGFPHVVNLGFPIRQIGARAPFDTRGLVLPQILVGQLAASQETYFNYHKSIGLFPFIQFFNGLCMYHLIARSFPFRAVVLLGVHVSLCMCISVCVCD